MYVCDAGWVLEEERVGRKKPGWGGVGGSVWEAALLFGKL